MTLGLVAAAASTTATARIRFRAAIRLKGRAATTLRNGVGVINTETATNQAIDEIDGCECCHSLQASIAECNDYRC